MKRLALVILGLVLFVFSFMPLMASAAYVFGGRQAFMDFITKTADGRFWMVGIPMFISCFGATFALLYLIFNSAFSPMKPKKKIYYLQEEDGKPGEVIDMDGNKVEFMNLGKKDSI